MFDPGNIDRRWIYFIMLVVVAWPLITKSSTKPAELKAANQLFELIENYNPDSGQIAFLAFDFGPNTKAENEPQMENIVEHLLRRRIPFAVFSTYQLAVGFMRDLPKRVADRLSAEDPTQTYIYGVDWVNLGYRPGASTFIQNVAKSDNLVALFKNDAEGTRLDDVPVFKNVRSLQDIGLVAQVTGLVGTFDNYVRFFQREGHTPTLVHGCTAITVPEAYIYLDSGQLKGLLEGIAGAAWYSQRLLQKYTKRAVDNALAVNTALGIAHLAIIFLILVGNSGTLLRSIRRMFG